MPTLRNILSVKSEIIDAAIGFGFQENVGVLNNGGSCLSLVLELDEAFPVEKRDVLTQIASLNMWLGYRLNCVLEIFVPSQMDKLFSDDVIRRSVDLNNEDDLGRLYKKNIEDIAFDKAEPLHTSSEKRSISRLAKELRKESVPLTFEELPPVYEPGFFRRSFVASEIFSSSSVSSSNPKVEKVLSDIAAGKYSDSECRQFIEGARAWLERKSPEAVSEEKMALPQLRGHFKPQ